MMSRVKKVKSNKKETLKATISGLALALSIGAAGSFGSYAWFVDQAKIENNQEVSLGNLHTTISQGFENQKIEVNNDEPSSICKDFTINNEGSFDQIAYIRFKNINIEGIDMNSVKYTLAPKYGETLLTVSLNDLDKQNKAISIPIPAGDSVELESVITVPAKLKVTDKSKIGFDLRIDSHQTNSRQLKGGDK